VTALLGLNVIEAIALKQADRRAVLADVKALGVNDIRVEIPWSLTKWSSSTDPGMNDIKAAGLNPLVLVVDHDSYRPTAAAYGAKLGQLAARYPWVKAWQVWNEQNSERFWPKGTPEEYVTYLQAAHTAIKKVNPSTLVVFGGLAACATKINGTAWPFMKKFTNYSPTDYLARAYAAGAKGFFDVLATHPYTLDQGFRRFPFTPDALFVREIAPLRALLDGNGDTAVQLWATEYGFPIKDFTAAQIATNLAAETEWLKTRVAKAFIYCYRDGAGGNFGLMDKKNVARPARNWLKGYLAA
jgi:hypothetical protein